MQPETNGLSNLAKSVPALDAGRGLFRAKSPLPPFPTAARVRSPSPPSIRSPVKVPERFKSPEPVSRWGPVQSPEPAPSLGSGGDQSAAADAGAPGADEQGRARRKVVKVVRRVVKKVLPADRSEAASGPVAAPSFSFKHDSIRSEDDVSQGLTTLMSRGRTREPRPRPRREERPEKLELEAINGSQTVLEGGDEDQKAPPRSGPARPEVQPIQSGPASLPAVLGFLPPPKPATLAPPPGFIPAPSPAARKATRLPQEPASPQLIQTPPPSSPGPPPPASGQSSVSQPEVERLSA